VNYYISVINNAISASNFTYQTYIRKGDGGYYRALAIRALNNYEFTQTVSNTNTYREYIWAKPDVCNSTLISKNWIDAGIYYYNDVHSIQVAITNTSDPLNNFKVESYIDYNTKKYNNVPTKIFEKINGEVTTWSVGTTIYP
jgi:hypothetical protein